MVARSKGMRHSLFAVLSLALTLSALACDEEEEGAVIAETEPANAPPLVEEEPLEGEQEPDPTVAAGAPDQVFAAVEVAALDLDCPPAAVYFETDSAELSDTAKAKLDVVADCLQETPWDEEVDLRGYTDPRASEDYNEILGRQRATAVASYLQRNGADDNTFEIHALGEDGATEDMPVLWPVQRNTTVLPGTEE